MTEHVLKVQVPYFDALLDGSKTFEVRRNDRAYQRGDVLVLREFDGIDRARGLREVRREVTFVYSGDPRFGVGGGMQPGVVVLALRPVRRCEDATGPVPKLGGQSFICVKETGHAMPHESVDGTWWELPTTPVPVDPNPTEEAMNE